MWTLNFSLWKLSLLFTVKRTLHFELIEEKARGVLAPGGRELVPGGAPVLTQAQLSPLFPVDELSQQPLNSRPSCALLEERGLPEWHTSACLSCPRSSPALPAVTLPSLLHLCSGGMLNVSLLPPSNTAWPPAVTQNPRLALGPVFPATVSPLSYLKMQLRGIWTASSGGGRG